MIVTDLDPWYVPFDPPEISDAELNAIGEANIRLDITALLKAKRAPAIWRDLDAIGKRIAEKIADLRDPTLEGELDNHIARSALLKRWQNLGLVIITQKDWHLKQVVVHNDEVNALVTRWLLLKYGNKLPAERGVPI